jgi:hypothetical protein
MINFALINVAPNKAAWAKPGQGQAVFGGFGLAQKLRKPKPPQARPKPGLLGQAGPGKTLNLNGQAKVTSTTSKLQQAWPSGILDKIRAAHHTIYIYRHDPYVVILCPPFLSTTTTSTNVAAYLSCFYATQSSGHRAITDCNIIIQVASTQNTVKRINK